MNLKLLTELTKRDFTERYSGSIIGVGWGFIAPLVNILIYTLIFSQIMSARLPGISSEYSYSIYLVSGLIPWLAFSSTVSRISTVFLDKKHIISKINLSLLRLPLFIVLSESITFIITMSFFFIFLMATGSELSYALLFLPFLYAIQQLFAFALGFILAQLMVFIRDIKEFTTIMMQLWFWLTPIVYVISIVPDSLSQILLYNPAYHFINIWQTIFVYQTIPNLTGLITLTLFAHALLLIAFIMYRVLEKDIRDFL